MEALSITSSYLAKVGVRSSAYGPKRLPTVLVMGQRRPSWLTIPNVVGLLMALAVVYITVAHIHIGSSFRALQVDSTLRVASRTQAEHQQEKDSLHRAIASLEEEHKRLQHLVQQSEDLIRKDKDLMGPETSAPELKGNVVPVREKVVQHSHSIDPKRQTVSKKMTIKTKSLTEDKVMEVVTSKTTGISSVVEKKTPDKSTPPSPPVHAVNQAVAVAESATGGTYSSAFLMDSTVPGVSPNGASGESKAMMVVCGTDGSGTRSVVVALTKLGVVMTSEDPETYDIHGDLMGGWPSVVKPVIASTHSLNYDPEKIDPKVHKSVRFRLSQLVKQAELHSTRPESHKLAVGGALRRTPNTDATRVKFGFKAPVAMTLAPYWAHLAPKFKLLHVLRDGRDIAFSANQGPVQKFYHDMYGGGAGAGVAAQRTDPRVKAIQLWSDWNTQLRKWSEEHASALAGHGGGEGKSFSYLSFHTEDLVSSDVQVRYRALTDLAQFVGSSMSQEGVCCIAQEGATFMGSHDRTSKAKVKNQAQEVSKRYGKWRGLVAGNKGLQDSFERVGGEALRLFGYEGAGASPYALPARGGEPPVAIKGHSCPNERTPSSVERCAQLLPGYAKS